MIYENIRIRRGEVEEEELSGVNSLTGDRLPTATDIPLHLLPRWYIIFIVYNFSVLYKFNEISLSL
jgi:hypothetical protein